MSADGDAEAAEDVQGREVQPGDEAEQELHGIRTGHPTAFEPERVAQFGPAKPPEPGHHRDGATARERRHQCECEPLHERIELALGIPRVVQFSKPFQQRGHSHDVLPSQEERRVTTHPETPSPFSEWPCIPSPGLGPRQRSVATPPSCTTRCTDDKRCPTCQTAPANHATQCRSWRRTRRHSGRACYSAPRRHAHPVDRGSGSIRSQLSRGISWRCIRALRSAFASLTAAV